MASERVAKTAQVSKNRHHDELKLTTPDDIDAELAWAGSGGAPMRSAELTLSTTEATQQVG